MLAQRLQKGKGSPPVRIRHSQTDLKTGVLYHLIVDSKKQSGRWASSLSVDANALVFDALDRRKFHAEQQARRAADAIAAAKHAERIAALRALHHKPPASTIQLREHGKTGCSTASTFPFQQRRNVPKLSLPILGRTKPQQQPGTHPSQLHIQSSFGHGSGANEVLQAPSNSSSAALNVQGPTDGITNGTNIIGHTQWDEAKQQAGAHLSNSAPSLGNAVAPQTVAEYIAQSSLARDNSTVSQTQYPHSLALNNDFGTFMTGREPGTNEIPSSLNTLSSAQLNDLVQFLTGQYPGPTNATRGTKYLDPCDPNPNDRVLQESLSFAESQANLPTNQFEGQNQNPPTGYGNVDITSSRPPAAGSLSSNYSDYRQQQFLQEQQCSLTQTQINNSWQPFSNSAARGFQPVNNTQENGAPLDYPMAIHGALSQTGISSGIQPIRAQAKGSSLASVNDAFQFMQQVSHASQLGGHMQQQLDLISDRPPLLQQPIQNGVAPQSTYFPGFNAGPQSDQSSQAANINYTAFLQQLSNFHQAPSSGTSFGGAVPTNFAGTMSATLSQGYQQQEQQLQMLQQQVNQPQQQHHNYQQQQQQHNHMQQCLAFNQLLSSNNAITGDSNIQPPSQPDQMFASFLRGSRQFQ